MDTRTNNQPEHISASLERVIARLLFRAAQADEKENPQEKDK